MIEGEQAFDLVREHDTWKIFLNWAAGVKVAFKTSLAGTSGLEATLPQNEVITQTGELFNVVLKIRNRSDQDVFTRIGHLIEPQDVGDHLDLVECGFLVPVRIPSGTEVEYLSTYLLRASIPESLRQVRVTYAFKVEK